MLNELDFSPRNLWGRARLGSSQQDPLQCSQPGSRHSSCTLYLLRNLEKHDCDDDESSFTTAIMAIPLEFRECLCSTVVPCFYNIFLACCLRLSATQPSSQLPHLAQLLQTSDRGQWDVETCDHNLRLSQPETLYGDKPEALHLVHFHVLGGLSSPGVVLSAMIATYGRPCRRIGLNRTIETMYGSTNPFWFAQADAIQWAPFQSRHSANITGLKRCLPCAAVLGLDIQICDGPRVVVVVQVVLVVVESFPCGAESFATSRLF